MPGLFIGTSGWQYRHWKETLYKGVRTKEWLEHYANTFDAVEVNGSFYRLQARETYAKWVQRTPESFSFAIRGHRFTTHNKKLLDPHESIRKQVEPTAALGSRLRAVLWQTPPSLQADLPRLDNFLLALSEEWPGVRHVLEFRHPSWMTPEVAQMLNARKVANCISDSGRWQRWDVITTDLVYVRLHGVPHTYWSGYSRADLNGWAAKIRDWQNPEREVHVYFDNDAAGRAPVDALELVAMLA